MSPIIVGGVDIAEIRDGSRSLNGHLSWIGVRFRSRVIAERLF
jgi:hypothetical protein